DTDGDGLADNADPDPGHLPTPTASPTVIPSATITLLAPTETATLLASETPAPSATAAATTAASPTVAPATAAVTDTPAPSATTVPTQTLAPGQGGNTFT